jgi:hypothetical protein
MSFPLITKAVVIAQDPDNYQLVVSAIGRLGGQSPAMRVGVLTHGPRDAVRGDFPELPMQGTWGIVCFPSEDGRNGHWIGSAEPALNDASPGQPGVVSPRYRAHYAGGWGLHGPDGTTVEVLADGSYLLSGTALPAPTRHTVDGSGKRQATAFTAAERNPSPPGPYPASFVHKSGASVAFTAGGAVSAFAAAGQTLTLSANGATVTIGAAGQVTVDATSGEPLTLAVAGASITFDGAGNITLTAAGGVVATLSGTIMRVGGSATPVRLANGSASTDLYAS